MARLILSAERIVQARALLQEARDLPVPVDVGEYFTYVAHVKDLLRQARDLIKFITRTPSASTEMKAEVTALMREIEQANDEILHKPR